MIVNTQHVYDSPPGSIFLLYQAKRLKGFLIVVENNRTIFQKTYAHTYNYRSYWYTHLERAVIKHGEIIKTLHNNITACQRKRLLAVIENTRQWYNYEPILEEAIDIKKYKLTLSFRRKE